MSSDDDSSIIGNMQDLAIGAAGVLALYCAFRFLNSPASKAVGKAVNGAANMLTWSLSSPFAFVLSAILIAVGLLAGRHFWTCTGPSAKKDCFPKLERKALPDANVKNMNSVATNTNDFNAVLERAKIPPEDHATIVDTLFSRGVNGKDVFQIQDKGELETFQKRFAELCQRKCSELKLDGTAAEKVQTLNDALKVVKATTFDVQRDLGREYLDAQCDFCANKRVSTFDEWVRMAKESGKPEWELHIRRAVQANAMGEKLPGGQALSERITDFNDRKITAANIEAELERAKTRLEKSNLKAQVKPATEVPTRNAEAGADGARSGAGEAERAGEAEPLTDDIR